MASSPATVRSAATAVAGGAGGRRASTSSASSWRGRASTRAPARDSGRGRSVDSPPMFDIFRKRDFPYLWTAQLVSTIGSSLTDLAAAILVFRLTGSALNVGLVLIVTALPTLVFGLVAGVFLDRFDPKKILLTSDLIRGLLVVAIPTAVDSFGLVGLYAIIFLAASVRQFFDPAWESVLPEIASEEELAKANSFLSISSF